MQFSPNSIGIREIRNTDDLNYANTLLRAGWIFISATPLPSEDSPNGYEVIYILGWDTMDAPKNPKMGSDHSKP